MMSIRKLFKTDKSLNMFILSQKVDVKLNLLMKMRFLRNLTIKDKCSVLSQLLHQFTIQQRQQIQW
jgi:hypothetical protein